MTDEKPWFEVVVIPALLRHARSTYGTAMRSALAGVGFADIPGNGLYVIGALSDSSAPFNQVLKELGISRQAAGVLVDTLVQRDYLKTSAGTGDAGQLAATLTERGRAAAAVMASARDRIDAELTARVGSEYVRHTRATLAALIDLNGNTPS